MNVYEDIKTGLEQAVEYERNSMKVKELIDIMACRDGRELYHKVEEILASLGIDTCREDGIVKSLYEVCCDVAEVLNKGK